MERSRFIRRHSTWADSAMLWTAGGRALRASVRSAGRGRKCEAGSRAFLEELSASCVPESSKECFTAFIPPKAPSDVARPALESEDPAPL